MAVFNWDAMGPATISGNFLQDQVQLTNPNISANQVDPVEVGTDLFLVITRDANGNPLDPADMTWLMLENFFVRQVGATNPLNPATSNIVFAAGGGLWIGDRATDILNDDSGNLIDLSAQLTDWQVHGLGGPDTIMTGDGKDRVYGNTGADNIAGGAGNDSLYGGQENDTINGGSGNDNVAGDLGNDSLNGGSGNDILYGGAGNDMIDPDSGNDTVFAGQGNDSVTVGNSDTGDKLIYMDRGQDLTNIISTTGNHTVYSGDNDDKAFFSANAGDQLWYGEGGDDTVESLNFGRDDFFGGEDDDTMSVLHGSIGDKFLWGELGKDTLANFDSTGGQMGGSNLPNTTAHMDGGGDNDSMYYARGLFIVDTNNGGSGTDTITVDKATQFTFRDQTIQNIEVANFSDDEDDITLADGNVNPGATLTVNMGDEDDRLIGSPETNGFLIINGDSGDDTLTGGSLADTINGGANEDLMTGGGGDDIFRFTDVWSTDSGNRFGDFKGFADTAIFDGSAYNNVSAIDGYKGTDGFGATNNDNLLIATGKGYSSIGAFNEFLTAGEADTDKPGFYIFFNSKSGRAELWFDTDMSSVSGAVHIATFNNITSVNQLAALDEGPAGNNSGDFVIL